MTILERTKEDIRERIERFQNNLADIENFEKELTAESEVTDQEKLAIFEEIRKETANFILECIADKHYFGMHRLDERMYSFATKTIEALYGEEWLKRLELVR